MIFREAWEEAGELGGRETPRPQWDSIPGPVGFLLRLRRNKGGPRTRTLHVAVCLSVTRDHFIHSQFKHIDPPPSNVHPIYAQIVLIAVISCGFMVSLCVHVKQNCNPSNTLAAFSVHVFLLPLLFISAVVLHQIQTRFHGSDVTPAKEQVIRFLHLK